MATAKTIVKYQRPISELIKTAKALQGKAEQATEKANQFWISLGRTLAELKARKPENCLWDAFVRKHFGYSQPRADELIRIGDGRLTVEESRKDKRDRVRMARQNLMLRSTGGDSIKTVPVHETIVTPAPRHVQVEVTEEKLKIATPYYVVEEESPTEPVITGSVPASPEIAPNPTAEKVRHIWDETSHLIVHCVKNIEVETTSKSQLREVIQAVKALLGALEDFYAALPEDNAVTAAADRAEAKMKLLH